MCISDDVDVEQTVPLLQSAETSCNSESPDDGGSWTSKVFACHETAALTECESIEGLMVTDLWINKIRRSKYALLVA